MTDNTDTKTQEISLAAQALGRQNKGRSKTLSPELVERKRSILAANRSKRWTPKPVPAPAHVHVHEHAVSTTATSEPAQEKTQQ
jgi:hypothetical protein